MGGYYSPAEILGIVQHKGEEKANNTPLRLLVLGFMAGMYVALGFLAYVRIVGTMPHELGSFSTFLGALVFPVGLIAILMGGGELITGNMLMVAAACFAKIIPARKLVYNWTLVTLGNLLGALFTAYFLSHYAGLGEGAFLEKTVAVAASKVGQDFLPALVSGIGCNILVCAGVWLSFCGKDATGRILASYLPIVAFVAIGFQHVVANMYIIPAAIFTGQADFGWIEFIGNCVPVFIGNAIGGAIGIGLPYHLAYSKAVKAKEQEAAHV